jgi:hypothetical protein
LLTELSQIQPQRHEAQLALHEIDAAR